MPKRKAPAEPSAPRRSTRLKPSTPAPGANEDGDNNKATPTSKVTESKSKPAPKRGQVKLVQKAQTKTKNTSAKPVDTPKANGDDTAHSSDRWYWLMKAEPESRFENGVDVKFSIDDLASKTEPEPWDGIRAYAARNNLRSMKKGELAFFYHSNTKEPGLVGTMEIVQEHSPDLSAHNPKAPYYDPSSKPEDPKWSVVHVKFRSKFAQPVGLKELRELGKPGQPLENMQMLKQTRLSVSHVSPSEWEYLMDLVRKQGGEVLNTT
ncbi:PUA-like domain-containing protein [Xylaria arbuscula]|nr:PUA-like domain-containing protein [Xylaria arbuscula]